MITDLKKTPVDEELIFRVAKKDREAFEQLYESTRSIIYSFGLSILKNRHDAEDIMHDTYIIIFQRASSYRGSGKPLSWILSIVKRLSYNRLRDRKPTDNIDDFEISPEYSETEAAENRLIIDSLIRTLSDEERQIVILHAAGELKHREIAKILDLPLSTILSKYNRAIKKLRNRFSEKEASL